VQIDVLAKIHCGDPLYFNTVSIAKSWGRRGYGNYWSATNGISTGSSRKRRKRRKRRRLVLAKTGLERFL
jgi:hypothetical protein